MGASVGERRGQPAVLLAAGDVEVAFLPDLGMLGISLRHRGRQHLSLPGGLAGYRAGHTTGMPVLAPWANRLGGLRYRVGSRTVDLAAVPGLHTDGAGLPMHGTMVGDRRWEVMSVEDDAEAPSVVSRFAYDDPALLAAFPFPHELEVRATATAGGLTVATSLRPTSRRAVPVSFGWHPYYRLPGASRGELVVHLPTRRRLVVDDRQVPTGEEVAEAASALPLAGRRLDTGYRLVGRRRLALSAGARHVVVDLDEGYPFAQVFAPPGRPCVALEPMTAPANALVTGEHPLVAPGGEFTATFTVGLGDPA